MSKENLYNRQTNPPNRWRMKLIILDQTIELSQSVPDVVFKDYNIFYQLAIQSEEANQENKND